MIAYLNKLSPQLAYKILNQVLGVDYNLNLDIYFSTMLCLSMGVLSLTTMEPSAMETSKG